jgi:hypothetical protein
VRRLIAIRTWLPEPERALIDEVVRTARAKGVECAAWPSARLGPIFASSIDGAGAQSVFAVVASGKRQVLSSILLKEGVGIRDAWTTPPSSKREIAGILDEAHSAMPMRTVSADYLDRAIGRHIADGLATGAVPPVPLLEAAEAMGRTAWRAEPDDWRVALDALLGEVPPQLLVAPARERIIAESASWSAELSESWFEDDEEVRRLIRRKPAARGAALRQRVLDDVFEQRKLKWAERLARVASWLKDATPAPAWPLFAVLAHALSEGCPAASVGLIREMAETTIAATQAR